jgi:hypothetical protein
MEQKNFSSDVFDTWKGSEIVEKDKLSLVIFLMLLFFTSKKYLPQSLFHCCSLNLICFECLTLLVSLTKC